jgi:hypothetical protein
LSNFLLYQRAVDVGEALHCLFNLGQFRKAVDRLVENLKSTIQAAIYRSFLHPSAGAMRTPTHAQSGVVGVKSFFSEISECFDHINSIVRQGSLLDSVLAKRRDPHTHQLLLQDLSPAVSRDDIMFISVFFFFSFNLSFVPIFSQYNHLKLSHLLFFVCSFVEAKSQLECSCGTM